jgi:hypothetical protein
MNGMLINLEVAHERQAQIRRDVQASASVPRRHSFRRAVSEWWRILGTASTVFRLGLRSERRHATNESNERVCGVSRRT